MNFFRFKSLHLVTLAAFVLLTGCDKKNQVIIYYQHLANFDALELNNVYYSDSTRQHLYMIRSIVNTGKDAGDFYFDPTKLVFAEPKKDAQGETIGDYKLDNGTMFALRSFNQSFMQCFNSPPKKGPLVTLVSKGQVLEPTKSIGSLVAIEGPRRDQEEFDTEGLKYKGSENDPPVLFIPLEQAANSTKDEPQGVILYTPKIEPWLLDALVTKQKCLENKYDKLGKKLNSSACDSKVVWAKKVAK